MKRIKITALFLLVVVSYGFQPEGTAASCNNYRSTAASHRCMCAKAMMCGRDGHGSSAPDAKCKTFCRPEACGCVGPCSSRK